MKSNELMDTPESAESATQTVDRRFFLKSALSAGAFILAAPISGGTLVRALTSADDDTLFAPHIFVSIATDGAVTIVTHRSEMGTGIRTSLPLVVADELGASWSRVTLRQAIGDPQYGSQNTDGSRSIRRFFETMRRAGATARMMFESAAAQHWKVPTDECHTHDHCVEHKASGRKLSFAELVNDARLLEVPAEDTLVFRSPDEWKYIGKETQIYDLTNILTGRAQYGADVRRPSMVFASIERCPVLGGRVLELDAKAALKVPGVIGVERIEDFQGAPAFQPLGGVAVIATNTWAAFQGRRELSIQWNLGDHKSYSSEPYREALMKSVHRDGTVIRNRGDAAAELSSAKKTHKADYYAPHLAHAAMEPLVATAMVQGDKCEVWAPTQNPQAAQQEVGRMLGIKPEDVTVNVTLLGGGFGRKSKPDYCSEAAALSKKLGKPVQVVWTREDDTRHDYYHSVAAVHMHAALDDDGSPTAWLQRSAFPPIPSTFSDADEPSGFELSLGFTDLPYDLQHIRCEAGKAPAHTRIGWLRSVCHVFHAFAIGGFTDELAHLAGKDPLQYQIEILGKPRHLDLDGAPYPNQGEPIEKYPFDIARLQQVCREVAKLSGWGKKLPKGRGLGFACHRSFLSYVAVVVEVEVSKGGQITIPRVDIAVDCGIVVNPDRVHSQMEGATVFAASLALLGEITFTEGAVDQSNFHDYPVLRMDTSPRQINITLRPSQELPTGVGEIGVPPVTPAIVNAVFAATGKRVRELPLSKTDLSWG